MADEAKRSQRRLTGRKRLLLWFVIFLTLVPITGWLGARHAVWRYRRREHYYGAHHFLVGRCETGFQIEPWTPEAAEKRPRDMIAWHNHRDPRPGPFFDSWQFGWRSFRVWPNRDAEVGGEYSEAEIRAMRCALVDAVHALEAEWGGVWIKDIDECLKPDANFRGPIWLGIVGNGIIFSVLLTPVCVATWSIVMTTSARSRRSRRLRRGLCPRCRYQIQGLPENRCPECGETWSDDETSPASEGEA